MYPVQVYVRKIESFNEPLKEAHRYQEFYEYTMKGPSRKEESQQKAVVRHDYSKDISKINKCKVSPLPTTYDEARASCKARKRKERQESISSLCQERKVIRSNSEERPTQKKYLEKQSNIRRVSSSEDFQKSDVRPVTLTLSSERISASPIKQSSADIVLIYEDCEHEIRRSHERFSKPLTLKNKKSHKGKRLKARCLPKPKFKPEINNESHRDEFLNQDNGSNNNNNNNNSDISESSSAGFLQLLHAEERDRSPSPVRSSSRDFSPDIDLSTLHEQVDCSEPLLSCANHQINENTETLPGLSVASNRLLLSPRNSIIATHRIYLDKDVPQTNFALEKKNQNIIQIRLQKVSKHINGLKKKIKKFEVEFENKNGYKVSHADKLNDKNARKLYMELTKMKKEQRYLAEVCPPSGSDGESQISTKNLLDTIIEIEKKLAQKRETAKRPTHMEQMSNDELSEEKVAVQKALLYLESIHGRPDSKEDRNLVRPLYDRYRILKRLISKVQTNPLGNELATIHEDETMNFIRSAPSSQVNEIDSEKSSVMTSTDSSDTDTSISENLHSLTKIELIEQHRLATEEKKELRRAIKTFELEFQRKTGRMIQKEDKSPIEHVYVAYKKVKAKLKLLDALVGKQL